jgi:NADH-quinone oxidoreductase subunit N
VSLVAQTDAFVGPEIAWFALSPLLVLVAGALTMLVVGALTPRWPNGWYAVASASVFGAAGVLAMVQWDDISDNGVATLVDGAIAFDTFAMLVTIVVCAAGLLVTLLADGYLRGTPNDGPEIYALLQVAAAGGIVMGSANDFIVLFLGLETLSLAFYVLTSMDRRRSASAEAGIKYFVLGGFASAFFLYGIAMVYGATGSTNISEMVATLQSTIDLSGPDTFALLGLAFMLVGLAFKVAAVPFHMWVPDVYQGAPSPITAFMASAGKAAAFAAMLRVLVIALPFYRDDWGPVIWVLALLTLIVGSTLAIVQRNVKRMLAYSSVSHAGYLLVGVTAAAYRAGDEAPGSGMPSVMLYLAIYAVLVIGSFAVVTVVARDGDVDTSLDAFDGLARRRPVLAIAFTVFLLAQAGVPFTSGFVAKFGVIQAAVEEESYVLAVAAMVTAVIAAFVYLRIMVAMWLTDPADGATDRVPVPVSAAVAIALSVAFTIVVGVFPNWLIDATDTVNLVAR